MEVSAPAEKVYQALTVPSEIDNVWGKGAKVDLKVGGDISYGWSEFEHDPKGVGPKKILEFEPSKKLKISWNAHGIPTEVEFDIATKGATASIKLTHSGFGDHLGNKFGHAQGWSECFTGIIYHVLGKAVPQDHSGAEWVNFLGHFTSIFSTSNHPTL